MSGEVAWFPACFSPRVRRMSRLLASALILLAAACGDDGSSLPVDSAPAIDARLVDARPIDAPMVDAPLLIDAPASAITTACTNACNALGVCFMETDAGCVGECSTDLADCTAQQVQAVDACTTQACGDKNSSPLIECIMMVACVQL